MLEDTVQYINETTWMQVTSRHAMQNLGKSTAGGAQLSIHHHAFSMRYSNNILDVQILTLCAL